MIKGDGTLHAQFDLDHNITSGDVTYNNFNSLSHYMRADYNALGLLIQVNLYSTIYFKETSSNALDYPTYDEIVTLITG